MSFSPNVCMDSMFQGMNYFNITFCSFYLDRGHPADILSGIVRQFCLFLLIQQMGFDTSFVRFGLLENKFGLEWKYVMGKKWEAL